MKGMAIAFKHKQFGKRGRIIKDVLALTFRNQPESVAFRNPTVLFLDLLCIRIVSDGCAGEEQGRFQHQQLQGCQHGLSFHPRSHPHSHPLALARPHDLREAIYREMEKERIRQEIIMSEILRRRAFEVEVRREMLMERELALGRSNTFNFGSPSPMGLDLPMRLPLVETRSREERIVSLSQRNNLNNRRESDRSVPLPFQSASDDARVARNLEVKPIMEGVREKQKIILQAKPIQNATGANRHGKKAEKEMSCALCQVSATSEESLNDHLKGKMHETKEAELRAQKTSKNNSIGLTTKTAAKPIQGSGPVDPSTQIETKFTSESLPFSKSGDIARLATDPSQEILTSDKLKKESVVPEQAKPIQNATGAKRARSGSDASGTQSDGKKAKKEMSCALCQVSATSEKSLNDHLKGKRHKMKEAELRAQKTSKNYIGLTTKTAAKPIQGSGPVDPGTQIETKFTSESLPFSKSGDIARSATYPSQENLTSDKLKKESVGPEQAKPIQNATGAKRARSGSDASGTQSDGKKAKKEMSCALCQVSATSEKSLNDHLKGKRHKTKEAELRAQKTSKSYIGLTTKTAAKPIQGSGPVDPGTQIETKFTSESLPFSKSGDIARSATYPSQENLTSDKLKKESVGPEQAKPIQNATGAKRARSGSDASGTQSDGKKAKKEMSCALCQVSATSEESLNDHLKGKKHKKEAELRAQTTSKNYIIGVTTKTAAKPIQGSGPVDPGNKSETKFTSESLPFSKSPSQKDAAVEYTMAEDAGATKKPVEEWLCR